MPQFARFLAVSAVMAAAAPAPPVEGQARFEYTQRHMGVLARVVLHASDETTAVAGARAAFQRMADLDQIMSDYRPTSELMRLTSAPEGSRVAISDDLFAVLERAQSLARVSDGAFDVTAGPLVVLWRSARLSGSIPSPDAIAEARLRSGWHHLELDRDARTAQLLLPGMRLDLGAIAKGYAADEALAVLAALGIDRALVEIGGEIVVGAPPPGRAGWPVRLAVDGHGAEPILLVHSAVSTSGAIEQHVEIAGTRYSHVIDPRTGIALTNHPLITVTAPSAVIADALSTLVAVLGPEAGLALVARIHPEAQVRVQPSSARRNTGSTGYPPVPTGE